VTGNVTVEGTLHSWSNTVFDKSVIVNGGAYIVPFPHLGNCCSTIKGNLIITNSAAANFLVALTVNGNFIYSSNQGELDFTFSHVLGNANITDNSGGGFLMDSAFDNNLVLSNDNPPLSLLTDSISSCHGAGCPQL